MYRGVLEIESAKVGRWKTFLWLYKSGRARGRAKEGLEKIVWRRSSRPKKVCEKDDVHASLCYLFRHRKVFFDSCVTLLTDYMVRHTTLVQLKVFALIVMFVAMTMWGKNITDAATMAATVVGHSAEVIRHWAYNYIVSIYMYE